VHLAGHRADGFGPGPATVDQWVAALLAHQLDAIGPELHLSFQEETVEFQTALANPLLQMASRGGRILTQRLKTLGQFVNPRQEFLGNPLRF
jgi:hypothetical protein